MFRVGHEDRVQHKVNRLQVPKHAGPQALHTKKKCVDTIGVGSATLDDDCQTRRTVVEITPSR